MSDLKTRFLELTRMKYSDQAKWFLNGFWKEGAEEEAENIWKFAAKFMELDPRKKEGNELDEFWSHKFLESLGETLTVIKLREELRRIDLDANGKMALLEYLCFRYGKTVQAVIDSPQGDNTEEINEASAKLQAVQDALMEVSRQLEEQKQVENELKQTLQSQKQALENQRREEAAQKKVVEELKVAETAQKKALEDQRAAEDVVRNAEADLRKAVDDLKAQEDSYKQQVDSLTAKSQDSSASQVSRSKAANELAQLKQEDPLPLRKAKLTQEAALRKVEKERKAQEIATAKVEEKTREVEGKRKDAEEAARQLEETRLELERITAELEEKKREVEAKRLEVENAVQETETRCREAEEYLEQVKKKGGVSFGAIWFMEREIKEAQKYLPKRKQ